MAADYTTLPMRGHIAGRASEKNSVAWRVIAEIVAFVVEGGIKKAVARKRSVGSFPPFTYSSLDHYSYHEPEEIET